MRYTDWREEAYKDITIGQLREHLLNASTPPNTRAATLGAVLAWVTENTLYVPEDVFVKALEPREDLLERIKGQTFMQN